MFTFKFNKIIIYIPLLKLQYLEVWTLRQFVLGKSSAYLKPYFLLMSIMQVVDSFAVRNFRAAFPATNIVLVAAY